jgi:hypothetical protein
VTQKQYDHDTRSYRRHIGVIDNAIKHAQNRLRWVEGRQAWRVITGYYVEAPQKGGSVVGPAELVHPGNGAFSYNRDLRVQVTGIVAVSAALAHAAASTTGRHVSIGNPPKPSKELRRVAARERLVFNDEALKPWPAVTDLGSGIFRVIEHSFDEVPETFEGPLELHVSMRGDGVTRSFRVPYGYDPTKLEVRTSPAESRPPAVQIPAGMSVQRMGFDVDVELLAGPRRSALAAQARILQASFDAQVDTLPPLEVAAGIFGAIGTALEGPHAGGTHAVDVTFVGGPSTRAMARNEVQAAMRTLEDEWWTRLAATLDGHAK